MPSKRPDLEFGGLSLWIMGRQFPDSEDYWDGNWLNVLARVLALGASVEVQGPIIHLRELQAFQTGLRELERTVVGTAALKCLEPAISVAIEIGSLGQGSATFKITPDHLNQSHSIRVHVDQTQIADILKQCSAILAAYEIRKPKIK